MDGNENRHIARDSLFLMADLRIDGLEEAHRIKVRNLSSGGMMGEGPVRVQRGAMIHVHIRNLGWVEGSIAWVQDNRFGIAFSEEIDPKDARALQAQEASESATPRFIRVPVSPSKGGTVVRKI